MGFYRLDESGYFFKNGSVVKVSKKPDGVKRYIIYEKVDKPPITPIKESSCDMQKGEILEVVTESLERIFFVYDGKKFKRKYFKPVDILEGEDEFLKHLGLLGLRPSIIYPESPL